MRIVGLAFIAAIFVLAPLRAAGQPVQGFPIFTGEAQTGDGRRIPGTVTFIVRIISNDGPIRALNFTGFSTLNPSAPRGVTGQMCQRWTSSQGNGQYDVPSPGFSAVLNLQGESSLDTHFLNPTPPTGVNVVSTLVESRVYFPGGNRFPSTPEVGYGLGGPSSFEDQGLLQGAWEIHTPFQQQSVDAIYGVAGGTVNVGAAVLTG